MTDFALKIEKLAKKYIISHEESQGKYKTLRETISGLFKFKKSTKKEEFWALKDINLEIKKGEKVAIIGRNGAGKSTLLKLLSRITEPTEGTAKINGRVASLLEVGTGFHPELSGRENIYLNGAILGMSKKEIQAKFDDIVEFSGCEKFLDTPVKRYSSGMRVRLGFAVAAHLESEILIVDEVLAVGDAEFQKKCLGKMDEISKGEGRTIIFVSHNMNAVQALCDKGVVLEKGEVKFSGDIDEAVEVYNNSADGSSHSLFEKDENIEFKGCNIPKYINSGDDIEIKFEFKSNKDFKGVYFDLAIFNSSDVNVLYFKDTQRKESFDIKLGENSISFMVKKLNINNGYYYMGINLMQLNGYKLFSALHLDFPVVSNANDYTKRTAILNAECSYEVIN